jgi:endonuclease/exonuclease/phosphatase family metal-dependent hydrolase
MRPQAPGPSEGLRRGFSLLSFNVFIGSPFPFGRRFVSCLAGSQRALTQVEAVRDSGASIIALQECHHDSVLPAFSCLSSFQAVWSKHHNVYGYIALLSFRAILAAMLTLPALAAAAAWSTLFAAQSVLAVAAAHEAAVWGQAAVLALLACVAATRILAYDTVAGAFCTGTVQSGLAVLFDRSKFRLLSSFTQHFSVQGGDVLNLLRPRAYQALLLERLDTSPPSRLLLLHTHLNLGDDVCRSEQVAEVLAAADGGAVERLAEAAGLRASSFGLLPVILCGDMNADPTTPSMLRVLGEGRFIDAYEASGPGTRGGDPVGLTWSKRNPLANSVMLEPDGRIDHILYRPAPPAQVPSASRRGSIGSIALSVAGPSPRAYDGGLVAVETRIILNEAPFTSDHFGYLTLFNFGFPAPPPCTGEEEVGALPHLRACAGDGPTAADSKGVGGFVWERPSEPSSGGLLRRPSGSEPSSPLPPTTHSAASSISGRDPVEEEEEGEGLCLRRRGRFASQQSLGQQSDPCSRAASPTPRERRGETVAAAATM